MRKKEELTPKQREEEDPQQEKQEINLYLVQMSLIDTLRKDMFEAKKNGQADKATILGMAISSINNFKIETQKELTDEDVISVLRKEEKKLKESYDQFSTNGRDDLAKVEKLQLEVIQSYLPKLMSEEEIEVVVKAKVLQLGDVTVRDMGKVIGAVMVDLKGKADGVIVNAVVKKVLGI